MFTFGALLLLFDIEYLLEAFEEEEKQGEDRVLDIEVSVTLVAQFRQSLFGVGVDNDLEYLIIFFGKNTRIPSCCKANRLRIRTQ